ncbi:type II secretion system F family protein [Burkholderia cenocepacia]|uniref:type II secretion system F family protein n=1 Tax=Burkholderia cenocepacia TaxID=95486 RepID=UPI001F49F9B1|nr:type II secretion system F family protein [Burkholderia cenocepacia]MCW5181824.1 type II secretion system F family protein [Burkholderia cenocepacia]
MSSPYLRFWNRQPQSGNSAFANRLKSRDATLTWSMRKRFFQQASSQLKNDRELTQVIEDFRDRQRRRGKAREADAVHQIWRKVVDGATLVAAMNGSLTDLERTLLGAGEKSGELAKAMELIIEVREITDRMTLAIIGSFFAPTVYLLSLYAVLFMFGTVIVPEFAAAAPVSKWTGWAYAMYIMGQIAVGWFAPLALALLVGIGSLAVWALPRWTGPGRAFFDDYVFPFTTYREIAGFSWLVAYATLDGSGIPDTIAIESQIENASPWLQSRLRPIHAGLRNGLNMAVAMRRSGYDFPSVDLIDEVAAYVGYSNFAEMIQSVCRQYAKTMERRLTFKGYVFAAIFSGMMFLIMAVLQLGANELSNIIASSMGAF